MKIATRFSQVGFTLVELVVGIVVMAIALTMLTNVFFKSAGRSVEPMLQTRAAVFGQALMDEIMGKAFDETTPVGGIPACTVCTNSASFGNDTETRSTYNDVDDYHDYCNSVNPVSLEDASGNTPTNYDGYRMSVCVIYDGNYDGVSDSNIGAKLITVDIFTPAGSGLGDAIRFSAYRGNF